MTDDRPSQLPTSADLPADVPADPPESGMVPRFHPAHAVFGSGATRPVEPAQDVLLAIAGKSDRHGPEHLQQQAAELAQHLHTRERELAHWEATLNARSAAHDDQLRSARLWWQEQQLDLTGREAELEHRHLLLEQQAAQLERRQSSWEEQRQAQEQSLERQRQQLQAERVATEALNEQLRHRIEAQHDVTEQQQQCRALRAELEQLRATLREREASLTDDRRTWELEKERQHQRTLQQRLAIAQHWRLRGQTLQMQQRLLRQRREQLDQRQQALERLQAELHDARRELLEVRLAVELTHHGLSAHMSPSELTTMEGCVREFLADQTAALESARRRQRQDLQTLAASLTQQQEALAARHGALQHWAQERQQEFDSRTAQIDLRERELEQLYEQLVRDKQTWLAALDEEFSRATNKASCP